MFTIFCFLLLHTRITVIPCRLGKPQSVTHTSGQLDIDTNELQNRYTLQDQIRPLIMYRQFDNNFKNYSLLGSDEAWLQAHVVNDRSVIKQNMDMESYTLSSTADDDGKFQPICKYQFFDFDI